jgi:tyrosinase
MIDKIWYDWQHRHPKMNANSFIGGSVQRLGSLREFEKYPNGGPPFLSVCACDFIPRDSSRFSLHS